jgi:hypothetical protein
MDMILGIPPGKSYCARPKNTNKLSGAVTRETVAELTMSLAEPCIILLSFYLLIPSFFLFFFIMNSTLINQYTQPMSMSFKPPKSSKPILAPGYELRLCFINMIRE